MKKNITMPIAFLTMFFALCILPSWAGETVLTFSDIQKLDPGGKVFLAQILDNGDFLFISKDAGDQETKLLRVSPYGRRLGRTNLPFGEVEYVQALPGGGKVLIYSQRRYSFSLLEIGRSRWSTLESQSGSEPGFALFGGKKSRLFIAGKDILAWGYFYDRSGDFASEWLVRLNMGKKGHEFAQRIVEMTELLRKGRDFSGINGNIGFLDAGEEIVIFTIVDENGGTLLGFNIKNGSLFKIDDFALFLGGNLSPDGRKAAYSIRPKGSNGPPVLFVYDLAAHLPTKATPGEFTNPVFNMDGSLLAVESPIYAMGKIVATEISIIATDKEIPRIAKIPAGGDVQDYHFVKKNRLVVVTKKGDIRTISY